MKIQQHRIEFLLEAEQPIKHLAESFGNMGIIASRKVRQSDGTIASVPMVSGDAMRHGIREAIAHEVLRKLPATDANGKDATSQGLSEAALRLLFAGGMVTGRGDSGSVKMGEYRKMVGLMPWLGFLGGCAENRTIPGRLEVSDATLVCAESERHLSPWVLEELAALGNPHQDTFRSYVENVQRVRMDPSLDPAKRLYLDGDAADAIDRRLEASATAAADGNDAARESTKSTMMPRRFERIIEGALFHWSVTVTLTTELEEDAFYTALCAFLGNMIVGGGRSVGHGKMRVLKAHRAILRTAAQDSESGELGIEMVRKDVGRMFFGHMAERGAEMLEYLKTVNA